ncbi:MAG TPA: hypothetical protein VLM80_01410 [Anaerolineales bacterium]|nr:hypothetical protein [Anaerolineales bacterium]
MSPRFERAEVLRRMRNYILALKPQAILQEGQCLLTVRARQIHADLQLPLKVSTASAFMDEISFTDEDGLRLVERSGRKNSPDAKWVYEVLDQ